jgi:phage virion morphogenesis protein
VTNLVEINELAAAIVQRTAPAMRRKLLGRIAREVRKSQADRIARQVQPDGAAFAPRKEPATSGGKGRKGRKGRKGQLRQKVMFRKLRLARFLKAGAGVGEAWVGFAGRAAAIARVHQDGLDDSPVRGGRKVRYARRVLLGLTDAERSRMLDMLLESVGPT